MTWEYKTVTINHKTSFNGGKFDNAEIDKALNELGIYEWELVSAVTSNEGLGDSRSIILFLKRKAKPLSFE